MTDRRVDPHICVVAPAHNESEVIKAFSVAAHAVPDGH